MSSSLTRGTIAPLTQLVEVISSNLIKCWFKSNEEHQIKNVDLGEWFNPPLWKSGNPKGFTSSNLVVNARNKKTKTEGNYAVEIDHLERMRHLEVSSVGSKPTTISN